MEAIFVGGAELARFRRKASEYGVVECVTGRPEAAPMETATSSLVNDCSTLSTQLEPLPDVEPFETSGSLEYKIDRNVSEKVRLYAFVRKNE